MVTMQHQILHGDCLDRLKSLPDNSVDAVVTDPPYGLSREPNIAEVLGKWLNGEDYHHRSSGFMGNSWDSFVPGSSIWMEVNRVLKPGGYLSCFAGTRTQDLMTISLRLGGFNIRDCIAFLFMNGFPKGQDLGRLIEKSEIKNANRPNKLFEQFRDVCIQALERDGKSRKELREKLGNHMLSHYLTFGQQPALPKYRDYLIIRDYLELGHQFDEHFPKEAPRMEQITKRKEQGNTGFLSALHKGKNRSESIQPQSELAQKWAGYSSHLKPGHEPIIIARKSTNLSSVYNVLTHGVGALHIDAARIPNEERYPANVVTMENDYFFSEFFSITPRECSKKAGTKDRQTTWDDKPLSHKNDHPTVKNRKLMAWLIRLLCPPGGTVLDPFCGSGSTLVAAKKEGFSFIGIEREAEFVKIAKERCK
jgi:DNA modification methylase